MRSDERNRDQTGASGLEMVAMGCKLEAFDLEEIKCHKSKQFHLGMAGLGVDGGS